MNTLQTLPSEQLEQILKLFELKVRKARADLAKAEHRLKQKPNDIGKTRQCTNLRYWLAQLEMHQKVVIGIAKS